MLNNVVNSVNENSTRAVLDDAFECLCKFEELIAENNDIDYEWESDFISNNMLVVGSFWKAKGGPAGPNGERIKEMVVDLTRNSDLDEEVLEQIWEEEEMEEALKRIEEEKVPQVNYMDYLVVDVVIYPSKGHKTSNRIPARRICFTSSPLSNLVLISFRSTCYRSTAVYLSW